jgi:hypothetical protein
MISRIIPMDSVKDISHEVLREDGKIKLMPSSEWRKYKWDDFRAFCHVKARYSIPTIEMIDFLRTKIGDRKTIEIGAGNGDLGFHLGIHMTDSKLQNRPEVAIEYKLMGQPTINYPEEIEEMEALIAVLTHKPQVVIGSWITAFGNPTIQKYGCNLYGINENIMLDHVDTYILIGNKDQHGDKPIMNIPHEEYIFDWHVSRGKNQQNNRIWIWNRKL